MLAKAEQYLKDRQYEDAFKAYGSIVEKFPDEAGGYIGRAESLIKIDDSGENIKSALEDYLAALDIDKTSERAALGVADVYIRSNDFEKAHDYLETFLENAKDATDVMAKMKEFESESVTDSNGNVRRLKFYNEGELTGYHIYDYSKGEKTRVSWYSPDGTLNKAIDIYTEGNVLYTYSIHVGKGGKITKSINTLNDDGNVILSQHFDENDEMTRYTVFEYDGEGNRTRLTGYNPDDSVNTYTVFEYENGKQVRQNDYAIKSDGQEISVGYILYLYDEKGNSTRMERYESDGTMYQYTEYLHDEDGNMIGENTVNLD